MNNQVFIKVEGKNIYRFLRRLEQENINLLQIDYHNIHRMDILISIHDVEKLENLKTSYTFTTLKVKGPISLWFKIRRGRLFLIFSLFAFLFFLVLTSRITAVEVIHSDSKLRQMITETLKKKDIKKGSWVKTYQDIQKIKKDILNNNQETIEWIEIERMGTKYVVRLEERILPDKKAEKKPSNIVSNSYAIIKKIDAKSGEIIKNVEDYVHPGDIIISGTIMLNDTIQDEVTSKGSVYGEVWYHVIAEYPLHYQETIYTGSTKKVYTIKFLNRKLELTTKRFKDKKSTEKKLLSHMFLPFSFNIEEQKETKNINQTLKKEEAIKKAMEEIKKKIESTLSEKEHIISIKKLNSEENNSKIILETFVSVYKEIGVEEEIIPKPKE